MKKTLKKFMATALLVVGVVSATLMTSAKSSPWLESPATECGTWTRTNNDIQVVSSDQRTITADRVYLEIKEFDELPVAFGMGARVMRVNIYDYDVYNADDLIKRYNGYISSRTFVNIYEDTSFDVPGAIDNEGENEAQIYMSFYIPKVKGDPTTPSLYSGIFKYKFSVKCDQ